MRNPGIDVLRGLSIVLVVTHHLALRIPLKKTALAEFVPMPILRLFAYRGYHAVFIFFVISGFLIASNAITRFASLQRIDLRRFYLRRASRILPCLFLLVGVLSVFDLCGFTDYAIDRTRQSLPGAIASALGLYLNWYEAQTGYLPGNWDVLWSLSIEEVFYLAFPIVCMLQKRLLIPLLALLALSSPLAKMALDGQEIWQEKAYFPGMAAIATGVLGALMPWRSRWFSYVGAAGLIAVFFFTGFVWETLGEWYMLLLTFSTAFLVMSLRGAPRFTGWLQSFGRLSYEIYLTHMFVVFSVVTVFKALGANLTYGYLWYVPALALSWGLGWLVARYISVPAEKWMRGDALSVRPTSSAAFR